MSLSPPKWVLLANEATIVSIVLTAVVGPHGTKHMAARFVIFTVSRLMCFFDSPKLTLCCLPHSFIHCIRDSNVCDVSHSFQHDHHSLALLSAHPLSLSIPTEERLHSTIVHDTEHDNHVLQDPCSRRHSGNHWHSSHPSRRCSPSAHAPSSQLPSPPERPPEHCPR